MKSYAKVIFSMLVWGTLPVFVSNIPFGSGEIVMWRIIFGSIFLGTVFLFTKKKAGKAAYKKLAPRLIFTGFIMGANWVALFESYRCVDVSVATLLYYMAPIIVMIASVFLFKEHAGIIKVLSMAAAITGMLIVTGVTPGGSDPVKGIILGLASAVMYASVTLVNKGTKGLSGLEMTLLQLVGSAIIVIPYAFITHEGLGSASCRRRDFILL